MLVQKEHIKSEDAALCEMAGCSTVLEHVILPADQGYESYNNFIHLEQAGWKYLICLEERGRSYAYGITLPDGRCVSFRDAFMPNAGGSRPRSGS